MSNRVIVVGAGRVDHPLVSTILNRIGLRLVLVGGVIEAHDANGNVCFEVSEPVLIDPGDVPGGILIGGDGVWQVTIQVQSGDSIPADEFGRSLARAVSGVMYDETSDEVWPPNRRAQKVRVDTPVRALILNWYGFLRDDVPPLPRVLVEAANSQLGMPLVRRYGAYDPYPHVFADGGVDAMTQVWRDATYNVGFDCSGYPYSGGQMTALRYVAPSSGMWEISLKGVADAFVQTGPRERLLRFFMEVADNSRAVYATARVIDGWSWSGNSLSFSGDVARRMFATGVFDHGTPERPALPGNPSASVVMVKPGLLGVTAYPTWWLWFGGGYLPLVDRWLRALPTGVQRWESRNGVFVQLALEPATEDELRVVARRSRLRWLPGSLVSKQGRRRRPARIRPEV